MDYRNGCTVMHRIAHLSLDRTWQQSFAETAEIGFRLISNSQRFFNVTSSVRFL